MTKSLERSLAREEESRGAPRSRDHLRRAVLSRSSAPLPPVRAPLAAPPHLRPPDRRRRRRPRRRQPRLRRVAGRGVDARRRQPARVAALGPGQHVAEPVRAPRSAGGAGAGVACGSRPTRCRSSRGAGRRSCPRSPTPRCGRPSARSASTASTPARSSRPGGSNGRRLTPSVDGHFDRISMSVDPEFGTEDEFRRLCATAAEYEGTVIDDIVPGHTGKGADFRLAEMGYGDYPGIYHMVSIREDDWGLLPEVPEGRDSVNLDGGDRAGARARRLHHRPAAARDLLRAGRQGDQLERDAGRGRRRRRRAALGLPALLQGGPAVDQLARPVLRRHAAGDRRRAARAGRPGSRRAAAGRQRLPRRREDRRGLARVVGGAPAFGGRQPPDREHDPQDGRVLLPGAQPGHGRHQGDGGVRRGPVLRLRHAPRLPPRAGHGRHRVPAADAEPQPRARDRPRLARARAAEPRRAHARARALLGPPPRRPVHLPRRGDDRRRARRAHPRPISTRA